MSWDKSDKSIEDKFNSLREKENILEEQLRQIRKFQTNINNIKLVGKEEIKVIKVGEKQESKRVINFYPPQNNAGNDMNEKYRTSQKTSLIVNIDKFLVKLNQ